MIDGRCALRDQLMELVGSTAEVVHTRVNASRGMLLIQQHRSFIHQSTARSAVLPNFGSYGVITKSTRVDKVLITWHARRGQ